MLSMTGFGKAEQLFAESLILTAEISSVNRKQLEIRCNLPPECTAFEDKVRKTATAYTSRGALQVRVTLQGKNGGASGSPQVDMDKLLPLIEACRLLRKQCGQSDAVEVEKLLAIPGIVIFKSIDPDSPLLAAAFEQVLKNAFENFHAMRQGEGENLKKDLYSRLGHLKELLVQIEPAVAGIPAQIKQRLLTRLEAENIPVPGNEEQLLREVLFYADRADVTEEVTRLKSHFEQFVKYLEDASPRGRSLDFLAQEMFREINTLGNKAGIPAVSALVVEFKSELEKMREQIQNVE